MVTESKVEMRQPKHREQKQIFTASVNTNTTTRCLLRRHHNHQQEAVSHANPTKNKLNRSDRGAQTKQQTEIQQTNESRVPHWGPEVLEQQAAKYFSNRHREPREVPGLTSRG